MSKKLSLKDLGRVRIKKKFPKTIAHKIFGTNSSLRVK